MEILLEREWLPQNTCQPKANTSKENSDVDSSNGVAEVLDITEAAIRALNNPPKANRTLGTTNSSFISAIKSCGSVLSPREFHSDVTAATNEYDDGFQYVFTHRQPVRVIDNSDSNVELSNGDLQKERESVESRSSTASDVLRKATSLTDHDLSLSSTTQLNLHSIGNHSIISTVSDTKSNVSNSGFLTGNLKKVKLSSKKLKEVDSPFDESILSQNISKFSGEELPENLVKRNSKEVRKHKKGTRKSLQAGEKEDIFQSQTGKHSHKKEDAMTSPKATPVKMLSTLPQDFNGLFSPLSSVECVRNDNYCKVQDVTGSVERHIPMDVIVHLTSPSESSIDTDLQGGRLSETERHQNNNTAVENKLQEPTSKVTSSPQRSEHHCPMHSPNGKITPIDRHQKCSDTEIITVPENIVTVQARDGNLSQASASSLNSESQEPGPVSSTSEERQPPEAPQYQAAPAKPTVSKFQSQPHHRGLFQGAAVEGSDPSQVRNTEDTVITQYNLTEKQKHLKGSIAKSRQVSVPVKRVVQPKIVQQEKKEQKKNLESALEKHAKTDPITTAAVAASAAVAATQPFLQAQKEVELKMTQILERLSALQMQPGQTLTSTGDSGVGLESMRTQPNQKISQLEKQVEDMTQKRLDHLEQMQQQYMNVQAQLIGISRNRPAMTPSGNFGHLRTSPNRVKYRPVDSDKSLKDTNVNEKILDTPAPRRAAPTPTVYERPPVQETKLDHDTPVKRTKSKGLLETILAETQSPPYAKTPPTARSHSEQRKTHLEDYERYERTSGGTSGEHEPSDLVNDLEDLKTRMKKVLNEVETVNTDLKNNSPKKPEKLEMRIANPINDAPLDAYLRIKDPEGLSSPYPIIEKDHGNAPVRDNFRDAQDVLQYVRQSRHLLEANLQAILRKRNEAEVYTLMEQLTTDSMSAEKYNIRKKVDQQIASMESDLEREILEELLKIEETKEKSFMIPERDVNRPKGAAARGGRVGSRLRGGVASRIDSGLRKPVKEAGPAAKKQSENLGPRAARPNVKPYTRPKPPVTPYETEEYMTRVYGKADYQNQRSMHKPAPYLHYQTTAKPKAPRPAAKVVSPDAKTKRPKDQYYFTANNQPAGCTMGTPQGQLIHMAIPLGKPRQVHTGPPPVALVTSTPQAHSTPLMQTPQMAQRVTVINVIDDDDEQDGKSQNERKSRKPNLTVQTLPQVNIDVPEARSITPTLPPAAKADNKKESEKVGQKSEKSQDIPEQWAPEDSRNKSVAPPDDSAEAFSNAVYSGRANDTVENAANIETEEVIDLPGFQAKPGTYHGPVFPPKAPVLKEPPPSSDVLAGDIHRREVLQNQATQWLEQELMARVLSDIASKQPQPGPSGVMPSIPQQVEDEQAESAIVDAIGEEGLKMFVEVGMDVDDDLVRSLIHQVILEKIQATLSTQNPERPSTVEETSKRAPAPKPRSRGMATPRQQSEVELPERSPIPTPQPTPVGSIKEDNSVYEDESMVYTPDPSMSLSSEKDRPEDKDDKRDGREEEEQASDYDVQPVLDDDRRAAASPAITPRSMHDFDTPEASLKDLPPQVGGVDIAVGTDSQANQAMWGSGHPFWNLGMSGPGTPPFVPVLIPASQSFNQLFNQLPVNQNQESQPVPSMANAPQPRPSNAQEAQEKTKKPKKTKRPPTPESESEKTETESEDTSDAAPLIRQDSRPAKQAETAEPVVQSPKIMVDRPTSPASIQSQESMISDSVNYLSEGQWLISARSEGEMRNIYPGYIPTGFLPGDDTFHGMDDLDADEISEGEIIQRLQSMQNPIVVLANQLNRRPISLVENRFRNTQPAVPSRIYGEVNPVGNQARSLPTVVRVQEQMQADDGTSPGEVPNTQPPLMNQSVPRPSTSRGQPSRGPVPNQSSTPNGESSLGFSRDVQGAQGGSSVQRSVPQRQNSLNRSDERGPLRLADMRKRGGIGAGPIMSTTDRPARAQAGRRSRSASQELILDSRDTLAGTISGGTFSHDSREFLVSNESIQSGRSLNILDLHTDNFGTGSLSERDLRTPDQMNIDEILRSTDYMGHTFSQSELENTAHSSERGMTGSLTRSALFGDTRDSERLQNDDFGTSGQFLDSLESSINTDQLLQRQPRSINSTQDGFNRLVGAQATPSGRSLMATVNLESTTSVEEGSEAQPPSAPISLSVKVPLMGQHESSDESIEDVSDL